MLRWSAQVGVWLLLVWSMPSADAASVFSFDIDGDGQQDALTDGLLILRHAFGFSDDTLTEGVVADGATRSSAAEITAYLDNNAAFLDIDGDDANDALTDGLLVLRYFFGFTGDTLTEGALGSSATRTTSTVIAEYIAGGGAASA